MEKVCDFCKSLRPIVYCKADAARLCLFCDAKVHSANTLSNRHPRALLCEVCKYHPAYVRCDDHEKCICHGCDCSLHKDTDQPQKRMVHSYMGCPSAKGFASLWGFDMDSVLNYCDVQIPVRYQFGKKVRGCLENSTRGIESEVEPSSTNVLCKESQNISTIFRQIIDLEKLQLSELNNRSSFLRAKRQSHSSLSMFDALSKLDKSLQHPLSVVTNSDQEMGIIEPFTSSFSPLEDLTPSSVGDFVRGEPFWKCESHDNDFEMWSENIQELGACEDSSFFDNSNIPDVDVSFRNFEELFECDQDMDTSLLDEKELSTSSMENNMTSLCKVDRGYAIEIEDASAASSMDKDIGLPDQASTFLDNVDRSYPIRKFDPATSLTLSCVSAHSNFTDYKDTSFSPLVVRPQKPNPSEQKSAKVEGKGRAPRRYKDKKNSRQYKKQSEDPCREERADARKGGSSKFVEAKGYESMNIDGTPSF